MLLLGNEAISRGAYEAGVRFASAYPGTPSTEITESLAAYDAVYAEWAPNEKVAVEAAMGASISGARAISAMKHVGLNVAADPLFIASYMGVNAGLVICVADDPGMHSSQNEQDSRHYAQAAKILMLEPSDSDECRRFVIQAFELSEAYDTPALIRLSTRVSHSRSLVECSERSELPLKAYQKDVNKYVMMPSMARVRHKFVEERVNKLKLLANSINLNYIEDNNSKIGVIASGITYQYAKEALGASVSYLKLGMIYPLPDALLKSFVSSVETCYVIEELDPIIETHCKAQGLAVRGKDCFSLLGEITSNQIKKAVHGIDTEVVMPEKLPVRPPIMCAGCPHRAVFYALKQIPDLIVSSDIGCYTLGALPPLNMLDTCACMGASIGMAHGMTISDPEKTRRTVALLGDSTFIHSGITGLIDVVYNNGVSTVIISDNSITGMTGHQDNPATGRTIKNSPAKALDLHKLCEAIGVSRVQTIDPFNFKNLVKVIQTELAAPEPSVIITKRPCALLKSFKRNPPLAINQEKCVNCGVCMKIGCPAISKMSDKPVIEPEQCVGCGYCAILCASKAISRGGV